ncbi:hypothetical protein FQZ97_1041680 [compost metagenome]
MGGADLHRQLEGRVGQQAFRQFHHQVVEVQFGADETGMVAPGGLADHMAILAQGGFGQFDHARQVEVGQPFRAAVEHAFEVVVHQAPVVPVDGLQLVDELAQGGYARCVEHLGEQGVALFVQGLEVGGGGHGDVLGTGVPSVGWTTLHRSTIRGSG